MPFTINLTLKSIWQWGGGGVFGLVQWTRRGEAPGVGEVVGGIWIVQTGVTCTSSTARVGGVG